MNRQLATIQIVKEIVDVAGTDNLQIATVLGWHVIINRNAGICIGDPVVYVEVDSQLPDKPEFEFLRKYGFKIKTMKMRGVVSQGIIFKMDDVGIDLLTHNVGDDVTEELEIIQFNEPAIPKFVGGKTIEKRKYRFDWIPNKAMRFLYKHCFWAYYLLTENLGVSFPSTIPKTGEVRVQNAGELLLKYSGTKCVVTEKIDGESFTAYLNNGVFGVCSHGVDLDLNVKCYHTELATKLKLEERMRMFSEESNLPNFAIQGELAGPGIRGNRQGLKERDIYFFNVYNIDNQTHMCYEDSLRVIEEMRLSFVPVLSKWFVLPDNIDELVRLSHGVTALSETFVMLREGLVIRPLKEYRDFTIPGLERGRVSFKVISPEYLLKYGE